MAAAEEEDYPHFRNVTLPRVQPNILTAFNTSRAKYVDDICRCMDGRFDDLEKDVFKAIYLLDTKLRPIDRDDLATFGMTDVSLAIGQFKPILLMNDVSLVFTKT